MADPSARQARHDRFAETRFRDLLLAYGLVIAVGVIVWAIWGYPDLIIIGAGVGGFMVLLLRSAKRQRARKR